MGRGSILLSQGAGQKRVVLSERADGQQRKEPTCSVGERVGVVCVGGQGRHRKGAGRGFGEGEMFCVLVVVGVIRTRSLIRIHQTVLKSVFHCV